MGIKIKNTEETSTEVISEQLREFRPLPMGRKEFDEWAERIVSGAGDAINAVEPKSVKYVLANLLMHLGPQEDHKPDIFFIKSLRKGAVNQVADAIRRELYDERKAQEDASKATDKTPGLSASEGN